MGEEDGNQRLRNWITRAFSHYHLAVFYGPPVRDDVPMTPSQYTDILFNPASMKFLQIKPLCWATANYLTDWSPSGSGYSVEWSCFSLPPTNPLASTSNTPPALTHTLPQPQCREGPLWENPRGPHSFQEIIYFRPHFSSSSRPSIHPKSGERDVCVCVYVCVFTYRGGWYAYH